MAAFVYILQDQSGRFYIGSTVDVQKRLSAHKHGHTQTTAKMINPKMVFNQKFGTLEHARKVERRLKNLKRKDYIEKIVKEGYIKMTI